MHTGTRTAIARLKLAAVGVVAVGAAVVGTATAASASPPVNPKPPVAATPTAPSGTPSGSPSGSQSGRPGTGHHRTQVGLVGAAALGAGLLPLGAWMWSRRRREEKD